VQLVIFSCEVSPRFNKGLRFKSGFPLPDPFVKPWRNFT